MKTCTCPHHYGPMGLEKYGTDAKCPFHGAPQAPPAPGSTSPQGVEPCEHGVQRSICGHLECFDGRPGGL
jgi:hypothetical protein